MLKDWFVMLGGNRNNHSFVCGKILAVLRLSAGELKTWSAIGSLTMGMIGMKKPRLKVKAADFRDLVPIVHEALLHVWQRGDEYQFL